METQNGIDQFVLAGNNYLDSPRSQWGTKFATQISPILNLKIEMSKTEIKEKRTTARAESQNVQTFFSMYKAG